LSLLLAVSCRCPAPLICPEKLMVPDPALPSGPLLCSWTMVSDCRTVGPVMLATTSRVGRIDPGNAAIPVPFRLSGPPNV
jgi:hypothetical protein